MHSPRPARGSRCRPRTVRRCFRTRHHRERCAAPGRPPHVRREGDPSRLVDQPDPRRPRQRAVGAPSRPGGAHGRRRRARRGGGSRARAADDVLTRLGHAARLHDVGKVAIPDAIISKAGPLSDEEWEFMKTHTLIGERILAAAPALAEVGPIVRSSHEWYDGRGYPDGLSRRRHPARVADHPRLRFLRRDQSERPYRPRRSEAEAIAELRRCAGTQFDPAVLAVFEQALARRDRSGRPRSSSAAA